MNIDSKKVLYSKGKNDECYTLPYAVEPILKYIPKGAIVWCPFDKSDSEFVKQISKQNAVVVSHIDYGQDFFKFEPEQWDVIISNPPFTNKRKFFERVLSFNKPFALIMSNTWLNDSAPKQLFKYKDLQLLMFDKRMKFMVDGEVNNKITFSSSYYCYDFLPKQIIMEELNVIGLVKGIVNGTLIKITVPGTYSGERYKHKNNSENKIWAISFIMALIMIFICLGYFILTAGKLF